MHDVLFGLAAGGGQPSGLGKVSLAGQVVAGQRIGYLINLPGDRLTEDGEEEAGSLIPAYTCTGGTAGSLAAARGPRALHSAGERHRGPRRDQRAEQPVPGAVGDVRADGGGSAPVNNAFRTAMEPAGDRPDDPVRVLVLVQSRRQAAMLREAHSRARESTRLSRAIVANV